MSNLIILNHPPYGTEYDYNGLRLAMALQKNAPKEPMNIFLLGDAVLCASKGQKTPNGYYNLERMLKRVMASNGRVAACGTCLSARGLELDDLLKGIETGTMDILAQATMDADKVLVF